MDIGNNFVPAVFFGKINMGCAFCNRIAMTDMVFADNGDSVFRKESREIVIAVNIFRYSVGDL